MIETAANYLSLAANWGLSSKTMLATGSQIPYESITEILLTIPGVMAYEAIHHEISLIKYAFFSWPYYQSAA